MPLLSLICVFLTLQFWSIACADLLVCLRYSDGTSNYQGWKSDDFSQLHALKEMFEDISRLDNRTKTVRLINLEQNHAHVTHGYLKRLIKGDCKQDTLEQFILDYDYFIGNRNPKLKEGTCHAAKEKVLKAHFDTFWQNIERPLFHNFAYFDLNQFLRENVYSNLEEFSLEAVTKGRFLELNTNDLIHIMNPLVNIKIDDLAEGQIYPCKISVQAKRSCLVENSALFSLIRLIAWKRYSQDTHFFAARGMNPQASANIETFFAEFFLGKNNIEISFHNFLLLGLNIDPVLEITKNISFNNCKIKIQDNDIKTLKSVQEQGVMKTWKELTTNNDGILYQIEEIKYRYAENIFFKIDFTDSCVNNPNKFLELVDANHSFFKTILLKSVPINRVKLWLKKLSWRWCIECLCGCLIYSLVKSLKLDWKIGILIGLVCLLIKKNFIDDYPTVIKDNGGLAPGKNGGVVFE